MKQFIQSTLKRFGYPAHPDQGSRRTGLWVGLIQRMAAADYRLIDITDLERSPKHGVLWLCEAAFLRNGSRLFDGVTSFE